MALTPAPTLAAAPSRLSPRYARREVQQRTAGLVRAMAHWHHRCTGCILDAWRAEARRARAEREEALRALLLRKGAVLSARFARGWFGAAARRRTLRRRAAARASLVGVAWRGWLRLIEARRRREDLEWLFGPAMGGLEAQLETKALQVIATLREEARAASELQSAAHETTRLEMAAQLSSTMDAVQEAVNSKAARSQLEQVADLRLPTLTLTLTTLTLTLTLALALALTLTLTLTLT
jgi:hypothetical protein